jgi:methylated-DNA-protein-cysteine methyltransferase-like protein
VSELERRVLEVIQALVPGEVVSYGDIAEDAGFPGRARAVGHLLATRDGLPWWRVVASNGRLVPGHEVEQARRLRAEGATVEHGRVRAARLGRFRPEGPRPARRPPPDPERRTARPAKARPSP